MDKILKQFGKEKIENEVKESNSFVEVTERLGLNPKSNAKRNVERCIKRLGLSVEHFESIQRVRESKVRYNEDVLRKLVSDGKNLKQILEDLDILPIGSNYNTLKKYCKIYSINIEHLKNGRNFIKFHWEKDILEKAIKESKTQKDTLEKLGLRAAGGNFKTLKYYIELYNLDISHFIKCSEKMIQYNKDNIIPLSKILVQKSNYNRKNLKERLYKEGLKKRECELCGQGDEWKGKHISLILDHINGVHDDNRLENLRIVCPNCNATLETHCRGHLKLSKTKKQNENKINCFVNRRKVERPNYELLIKEIENLGLEGTGRKYGVCGNSIKKWVKTYQNYNI